MEMRYINAISLSLLILSYISSNWQGDEISAFIDIILINFVLKCRSLRLQLYVRVYKSSHKV